MSPYGLLEDTWPACNCSKAGMVLLGRELPGMR
ncbi:hypothetical protein PSHT_02237 [Puccinia striiformis]|uniref:Uncharacterized protein n=2 Tax=Puccinia striiformis TaxID=27350 RepID=A0A2S4WID9_9BASI|nr:hypothetical protein PSTT_11807 [Puccinia striiformis]POW21550.1 hypothetical protein PSHT_02237 [Puccinia striiformis]